MRLHAFGYNSNVTRPLMGGGRKQAPYWGKPSPFFAGNIPAEIKPCVELALLDSGKDRERNNAHVADVSHIT